MRRGAPHCGAPELQIRRAAAVERTEEGTDLQGEADAVHAAAAAGGGDF